MKIKNLKLSKLGLAILLAGTISFTVSGCNSKTTTDLTEPLQTSIENNAENTYLDDILSIDQTLCENSEIITESIFEQEQSLEESINIVELLSTISDTEEFNDLSQEEVTKLCSYSYDDIELLVEELNSGDNKFIGNSRLKQQLSIIKKYHEEMIRTNGLAVSKALLKMSIKGVACQVSGLEVENYGDCTISKSDDDNKIYVNVYDTVSGQSIKYKLTDIYEEMGEEIYKIEDQDSEVDKDTAMSITKESLNLIKNSVYCNPELYGTQLTTSTTGNDIKEKVNQTTK
jgi:hypothetical protein